jgi:phospholipid-translocating ATPase
MNVTLGGAIMILAIWIFEDEFSRIVSITFTALIFNELLMVAFEIETWHTVMIFSQVLTLLVYLGSMSLLPSYFDIAFIATTSFMFRVLFITGVTAVPLYIYKCIYFNLNPPIYAKLEG